MTDEKQPELVGEKLFTQSELDEIIVKRLTRERKKSAKLIQQLSDYIQVLSEGGE